VEVVVVFEVIEPCVKFGTTGTATAVWALARADTTTTRARFFIVLIHKINL
jgi:hypothetical protein